MKKERFIWTCSIILLTIIFACIYLNGNLKTMELKTGLQATHKTAITELKTRYKNDTMIFKQQETNQYKRFLMSSITHLNKKVDFALQEKIVDTLIKECNNVPPLLIICLIHQESNFNPLAENKLGTVGLMQIIPKYHQDKIKEMGLERHELFYIENNIKLGVRILKDYFDSKGNIVDALQKYVGASVKAKAGNYIENIINNYITLQLTHKEK